MVNPHALYGWTGRLLDVDLTRQCVAIRDTAEYVPLFVGGMGMAAKIAWDELPPGVGPFDPDNLLMLMTGPLTGTLASGSSRVLVAGVAAQQRPAVYSRSGIGGHWGAELKFAGFDGIIVRGQAERPLYLWVTNGQAELRDAADLWGLGTYGVTAQLRARHGARTRLIAIGPAGERRSRIACLQTETGNAAGQGGFGGVMGAKRLKAIAVRGTGGVRVHDPARLLDLCLHGSRAGSGPYPADALGRRSALPDEGALSRLRKCGFCLTPCTNRLYMGMPGEATAGIHNAAQHCYGFSTHSLRAHIEARALVSDYGLNGWEISYGIIPWLQICRQQGLIEAVDGVEIPIPDHPVENLRDAARVDGAFLTTLLHKIARREGELGDALADGACYAAERLFGGAGAPLLDRIYPRRMGQTSHWNGHWGTGGSPMFPFWLVPVLQWCVDTRDPASDATHQYTEHVLRYLPRHGDAVGPLTPEQARAVCQRVYGVGEAWDPNLHYAPPETKTAPAIFHHDRAMVVESLVLCDREHTRVFSLESPDCQADTAMMSKLYAAVTGVETDEAALDRDGERVFNLLRAIDVRNHGRSRRTDEATAASLAFPAFTDGVVLDLAQFGALLDDYYARRGWDRATGWPTAERLQALGLPEVAVALADLATQDDRPIPDALRYQP